MIKPKLTIDKKSKMAYLRLQKKAVIYRTVYFHGLNVDLDFDNRVVGIEVFL